MRSPFEQVTATRRVYRALLALTLLLGTSAAALADTAKVTVDRALVWNRPSGVAVVLTQLRKDDTVEVVRRLNGWYEIIVPGNSMSAEIRIGYISATQAVIDSVGPPSPVVSRAMQPPPRVVPKTPGTSFFNIDGVRQRSENELIENNTVFTPKLDENTTFTTNYGDPTGWSLHFMGGGPVWYQLGVGFALTYHQRNRAASLDARIPHPYYYDTLRPASFTTDVLKSRETTFDFPAMFVPPAFGPIKVVAFAGPSIFRLSHTQVTNLAVTEAYPYDTVAIASVTTEEKKGTFWGYHAGVDVSVFFTRQVGVGGGIRYSHANIENFEAAEATSTGEAGGVSVAAGVRFRFNNR